MLEMGGRCSSMVRDLISLAELFETLVIDAVSELIDINLQRPIDEDSVLGWLERTGCLRLPCTC
jgi:hypothetical protein